LSDKSERAIVGAIIYRPRAMATQTNGVKGWNLMTIRKRVGISLIALALVGTWALPASAADEPAVAAEVPAAPAPDAVKTASPVAKAMKPRVAKHRVVKRFWRHRPIRVAVTEWPVRASYHSAVSYLVLGVGF
jgi:hypothetical protein